MSRILIKHVRNKEESFIRLLKYCKIYEIDSLVHERYCHKYTIFISDHLALTRKIIILLTRKISSGRIYREKYSNNLRYKSNWDIPARDEDAKREGRHHGAKWWLTFRIDSPAGANVSRMIVFVGNRKEKTGASPFFTLGARAKAELNFDDR